MKSRLLDPAKHDVFSAPTCQGCHKSRPTKLPVLEVPFGRNSGALLQLCEKCLAQLSALLTRYLQPRGPEPTPGGVGGVRRGAGRKKARKKARSRSKTAARGCHFCGDPTTGRAGKKAVCSWCRKLIAKYQRGGGCAL